VIDSRTGLRTENAIRWGEADKRPPSTRKSPVDMRDAGEIEAAVAAFARGPNGGVIVLPGDGASRQLAPILAALKSAGMSARRIPKRAVFEPRIKQNGMARPCGG
jgi:hypothetical protein